MKNKPDPADSSLRETIAARIEIKELRDPARQKEITDAMIVSYRVAARVSFSSGTAPMISAAE